MKILFIGGLEPGQTSRMRMRELVALGHEVTTVEAFSIWNQIGSPSRRLQQWTCSGKVVDALNANAIASARCFRPDLVWAEKQEYLRAETVQLLKATGARLLHYTPDPYFSLPWKRTRLMDKAIAHFDYLVTSKAYELEEYRKLPAKVIYVPLGFSEEAHRPALPASRADFSRFSSDVSFLGGWEPRREAMLDSIARRQGVILKIWGYGWDHLRDGRRTPQRVFAMRRNAGGQPYQLRANPRLAACVQGNEVYAQEYSWAISSARISLGFLRRICPDQHTTRTFEIPACGSMLLADRTSEHEEFFEEGKEAEFFSSDEEMLDKLTFYRTHEQSRARLSRAGFRRCHASGYSYHDRIAAVMHQIIK